MNRLLPLATIKKLKRKQRLPRQVTTSIKITRALDRALKAEARRQNRTQSFVIRDALEGYLKFRQASIIHEETEHGDGHQANE